MRSQQGFPTTPGASSLQCSQPYLASWVQFCLDKPLLSVDLCFLICIMGFVLSKGTSYRFLF